MKVKITIFSALLVILFSCKKSSNSKTSDVNLNSGLIAYYPFNGNANDASGNNLNGTVYGGVSFTNDVSGKASSAATFNGLDGYILVPDNSGKLQTSAVSVSLLVNMTSTTSPFALFENVNFSDASGFSYGIGAGASDNSKLEFAVTPNSFGCGLYTSNSGYLTTSSSEIVTNKWYNVVGVFSDSSQQFYVNGSLNASLKRDFSALNVCSSKNGIVIGAWWHGDLSSLNGSLDEIRVYNRALNQDEVNELAKAVQ